MCDTYFKFAQNRSEITERPHHAKHALYVTVSLLLLPRTSALSAAFPHAALPSGQCALAGGRAGGREGGREGVR